MVNNHWYFDTDRQRMMDGWRSMMLVGKQTKPSHLLVDAILCSRYLIYWCAHQEAVRYLGNWTTAYLGLWVLMLVAHSTVRYCRTTRLCRVDPLSGQFCTDFIPVLSAPICLCTCLSFQFWIILMHAVGECVQVREKQLPALTEKLIIKLRKAEQDWLKWLTGQSRQPTNKPVASSSILSSLALTWRKSLQRQLLPWRKCRHHRRCQRLWAARIADKTGSKQRQSKGRAEDFQMKMLHRFCTDPPQMLCASSAPRNTIKEPEPSPVMKAADSVQ